MIAADRAREAAAGALAALAAEGDAMLAPWPALSVGAPVMVGDIAGAPAYWLVPLEAPGHLGGRVIGAARVDAVGRVMTIGVTCRTPARIADCPRTVTGVTAAEAASAAAALLARDETASPPRFVHDGPPGREAWLVETEQGGRPARWITVTQGGAAARPAGARVGEDPGRE
jgi:hypothetical protein